MLQKCSPNLFDHREASGIKLCVLDEKLEDKHFPGYLFEKYTFATLKIFTQYVFPYTLPHLERTF